MSLLPSQVFPGVAALGDVAARIYMDSAEKDGVWVCFLLLNKDLTGEEGLEGGLLACGTAGSWQRHNGGREAC